MGEGRYCIPFATLLSQAQPSRNSMCSEETEEIKKKGRRKSEKKEDGTRAKLSCKEYAVSSAFSQAIIQQRRQSAKSWKGLKY